jgi:hypothetical protein
MKWNASTRVYPGKSTPTLRKPFDDVIYQDISCRRRSSSRASMSSLRSWSPIAQSSILSITQYQSSIFTGPPSRIRLSSCTGHAPPSPVRPMSRSHPSTPATMNISSPVHARKPQVIFPPSLFNGDHSWMGMGILCHLPLRHCLTLLQYASPVEFPGEHVSHCQVHTIYLMNS